MVAITVILMLVIVVVWIVDTVDFLNQCGKFVCIEVGCDAVYRGDIDLIHIFFSLLL